MGTVGARSRSSSVALAGCIERALAQGPVSDGPSFCEHPPTVVRERSRRLVVTAGQWTSGTPTVGSGPTNRRFRTVRVVRSLRLASLALAAAGCFLMSRAPERPAPTVSGPVPYVEPCATCHAVPTIAHYAESLHSAEG